jgi:hypothetical protein
MTPEERTYEVVIASRAECSGPPLKCVRGPFRIGSSAVACCSRHRPFADAIHSAEIEALEWAARSVCRFWYEREPHGELHLDGNGDNRECPARSIRAEIVRRKGAKP